MESERSTYMKITNAAISTMIFLVISIVSLISFFIYEKNTTKEISKESIIEISELKSQQLKDWYSDEVNDAALVSNNPFLVDLIINYRSKELNYHLLVKFLNQIKTEHLYSEVILLTLQGDYIASTNAGLAFDDSVEIDYFRESLKSDSVYVSDIFRSENDRSQYLDFISYVKDHSNRNIASLVFRKNPVPSFNEVVTNRPFEYKTAESYIVKTNEKGELQKYINSESLSECWISLDSSNNTKEKFFLQLGFDENGISDGKDIFSYYIEIPGTPWNLLVEVEKDDVYMLLKSKISPSIIFVFIISIVFFIFTYTLLHFKQKKIIRKTIHHDSNIANYLKRFNLVLDMLSEGVIISDNNGMIIYMNLKAEMILGWNLSELKNKLIDDYFRLRYEDTGFNAFSYKNWQTEESGLISLGNVLLIEKDNHIIPVLCKISPLKSNIEEKSGLVVIFENLSEKRYQESIIHKSEMRFRNFFQDAPDATLIVDKHGLIRHANIQSLLLFGYSINELTGNNIEKLIPVRFSNHSSLMKSFFENPQNRSMGSRDELFAVRKNGIEFPVLVSLSPINNDEEIMIMAVIRDVTKIKEFESELVTAKIKAEESDHLKSAFLANLSHEIRTPLNGIIGFSTLLKDENLNEDEIKKYSGLIGQSGEKLLELLNNVIDLSKIESGVETVNYNTFIVEELVESEYNMFVNIANNKNLEYKLSLPVDAGSLKLKTDNEKLGKILNKLLSNAFKFTASGSIELGFSINKEDVIFYVKDSGPNIVLENESRIFERFFQVNSSISSGVEGSGIGLAICKGYSDLLGGKIWFENNEGVGKTFYLKISRTK